MNKSKGVVFFFFYKIANLECEYSNQFNVMPIFVQEFLCLEMDRALEEERRGPHSYMTVMRLYANTVLSQTREGASGVCASEQVWVNCSLVLKGWQFL